MKEVRSMSQFDLYSAYLLSTIVYFDIERYQKNMKFSDYIENLFHQSYPDYFYQKMSEFAKQLNYERFLDHRITEYFNDNLKTGLVYYILENDDERIVVFRGSENFDAYYGTRGWEDWNDNLDIFLKVTDQQLLALSQMKKLRTDKKLSLCGHSKGGNLALFLAVCSDQNFFDQLDQVIAINAPGLNDDMSELYLNRIQSEAFQQKVCCYVNEHDCVSALFNRVKKPVVLASQYANKTLMDVYANHQLYAFECKEETFTTIENVSIFPKAIHKYIYQNFMNLSFEKKQKVIEEVQVVLMQTGSLDELIHVICFVLGEKMHLLDENDLQWVKDLTVKSLFERMHQEVSERIHTAAENIFLRLNQQHDKEVGENNEEME